MTGTAEQRARARSAPFGYACNRCASCCRLKLIHVNPGDIARLARRRGLTSAAFRSACTKRGEGVVLEHTETGACVFLGPGGCEVHGDRPLACRLYPLEMAIDADGVESWSPLPPLSASTGEYHSRGTVEVFLSEQDAQGHIDVHYDYLTWHRRARVVIGPAYLAAIGDLLDMDAAVTRHCEFAGKVEPYDMAERTALHLCVLYEKIGEPPPQKSAGVESARRRDRPARP